MGALETDLLQQMRAVSLADKEAHTRLVMALQVGDAVNRHLWRVIQDGHRAEDRVKVRGSRLD